MVNPTQQDIDILAKRHQENRLMMQSRVCSAFNVLLPTFSLGCMAVGHNKLAAIPALLTIGSVTLQQIFIKEREVLIKSLFVHL